MGDGEDDSQGKSKKLGLRSRSALLLLAFMVGVSFGIVVSQRLYIEANRAASDIPVPEALSVVREG